MKSSRAQPSLLIVAIVVLLLASVLSASAQTFWIDEFSTSTSTGEASGGATTAEPSDATVSAFETFKSGNTFTVRTTITNPATGKQINGIIELQARQTSAFLSFVPNRESCNPEHPWNVNGAVDVAPGASQVITLTSDITLAGAGVYDFYLVSVNRCCVGQSCTEIEPFGWQTLVAKDVSFGSGTPSDIACNYDFECDKKLEVATGEGRCVNPGTPESYCSRARKDDGGATQNTTLWIVVISLLVFVAFLILLVVVKK